MSQETKNFIMGCAGLVLFCGVGGVGAGVCVVAYRFVTHLF